jgi:hypothetical protein
MNNINNCESKKNNVEERKLFSQIKKEKRKKKKGFKEVQHKSSLKPYKIVCSATCEAKYISIEVQE